MKFLPFVNVCRLEWKAVRNSMLKLEKKR
jgi:hypothetical protein